MEGGGGGAASESGRSNGRVSLDFRLQNSDGRRTIGALQNVRPIGRETKRNGEIGANGATVDSKFEKLIEIHPASCHATLSAVRRPSTLDHRLSVYYILLHARKIFPYV